MTAREITSDETAYFDEDGKIRHAFSPAEHLTSLKGKQYLEVKWRLAWLRSEHPEAVLETDLVKLEGDFALFRAHVEIPGAGSASGYGSETRKDFFDFIEKAETKAVGRALAALGYGTQFAEDFEMEDPGGEVHVVDSPVSRPEGPVSRPETAVVPAEIAERQVVREGKNTQAAPGSTGLCTPAQLKAMYLAVPGAGLNEEQFEERIQASYGRLPLHLTKAEASEVIEGLKKLAARAQKA